MTSPRDDALVMPTLDLHACKLLYIDLQKKTQTLVDLSTSESLESQIQDIITDPNSDRLVLEMACKVYFLLQAKKYNQIDLKAVLDMKSPRASNYIVRGILATKYDILSQDLLYSIIIAAIETSLRENSIYTTIALNNLRLFCTGYKNYPFNFPELWRIVALHLSSRFIGAREEAMNILEFIVKYDTKYGREIARLAVEEWPWTYANKFYVLRTVIEGSCSSPVLLENLHLETDDLVDGLLMALKYRILYTSGQLLFRSLLRKDQLEVIGKFLEQLLRSRDRQLLHQFHVQWSKEIHQVKEELFEAMDGELIETLEDDAKLVLRNIFREQMVLEDEHEMLVHTDPVAKQHHYELLIYRVASLGSSVGADLKKMIEFLVTMKAEVNTTLRQHVFATFGHFTGSLMKIHGQGQETEAIEGFFGELVERIVIPPMEGDEEQVDYPEIILGVRLYQILMRILHCSGKSVRTADIDDQKRFSDVLERKRIFDGLSTCFFKRILRQLNSPYDDIRHISVDILLELFSATQERRGILQEAICEKMYFASTDDSRRIHGYFKVLVSYYECLKADIGSLYKEYKNILMDHYKSHVCPDPLASITSGIHIFDKINIVQEIVASKKIPLADLLKLMQLIREISQRMLYFLSLAQRRKKGGLEEDFEDITPSFQVIEESLQLLINMSGHPADKEIDFHIDEAVMDLEDNVTKRKDLLLSIWMTLRACGDLSATIVESTTCYSDVPELFSLAIEINKEILYRCRHKGAIETVGLSLGRVVAHISSTNNLSPAYEQLDSCLTVLFEGVTAASYSRRGAGFSFLILNLVKNDRHPERPLLKKCLETIFQRLSDPSGLVTVHGAFLHYLSVLVNDSSLTQDILPHLNEIISLCLERIESPEWNVRNAALRLFGCSVPKVIGQRQHSDTEWEPCQCTAQELQATMPKVFSFLEFCVENHRKISRTLLIAVLSFLSNVEWREIATEYAGNASSIAGHLFRLLSHPMEKVRVLSALCYARVNRHQQHGQLMTKLCGELFTGIRDPNLQHGLLVLMIFLCQRAQLESSEDKWQEDKIKVIRVLQDVSTRMEGGEFRTLCEYNRLYLVRFFNAIGYKNAYLEDVKSSSRDDS